MEKYKEAGITWWDYCGHTLVNSYPTYFEKLPPLITRINREKRNSKNYVLFLGETGVESNQAPCLSLVQFQIDEENWCYLHISVVLMRTLGFRLIFIIFI